MLNITKESDNTIEIVGTLKEVDIKTGTSKKGKDYASGKIVIQVDQEVEGKMINNDVVVNMMSMKYKKKDKESDPDVINKVYESIVNIEQNFKSLASAENASDATRVSVRGSISENIWISNDGLPMSNFQLSSNFINKAKDGLADKAVFELSGVLAADPTEETGKDGETTGRVLVKLVVVGYQGKANIIDLVAEEPGAAAHVLANWNKGDTVSATGVINMTYKTETVLIEQGFGKPIEKTKTISKKELSILGGSACGKDEDESYDAGDIGVKLGERKDYIAKLTSEKKEGEKPAAKKNDFGF